MQISLILLSSTLALLFTTILSPGNKLTTVESEQLTASTTALQAGLIVKKAKVVKKSKVASVTYPVGLTWPLPASYQPADLIRAADYGIPTQKWADSPEMQIRLAKDANSTDLAANLPARLSSLLTLCQEKTGEVAKLRSGYRDYATQAGLFAKLGFAGGSTRPGTSEHQSGLAVDISVGTRFISSQSQTFGCFQEYAADYGFILSYPVGNRYLANYKITEPWHWRYVGVRTARLVQKFSLRSDPRELLVNLDYYRFLDAVELSKDTAGLAEVNKKFQNFREKVASRTKILGEGS